MLSLKMSAAALATTCLVAGVHAQVPTAVAPALVLDAFESIGSVADVEAPQNNGAVVRKIYTVPAGRAFRLTDLSVDTRNANSTTNPCFFEVWRGTETQPVALAWSRMRVFASATYDRSWVTGPQFNPGDTLWVIGRFDPFNIGLRICSRVDPNLPSELRYALRGYLVRQPGH